MKRNQFLTRMRTVAYALLGLGVLTLASCAQDGFDDETFQSSVRNAVLESPDAGDITVTPSADGKSQTISWPVVEGAGGYLVSFFDTGNLDQPIVADSIVDGCTITVKREEDVNYRFQVLTLGNKAMGNSDAAAPTLLDYNTFAEAFAAIPTGTDLYEYFQANPIPDSEEALYYDLEPGGSYTLSQPLDFSNHNIVLRTTSKTDYATITYGETGSMEYCGGFSLKYLNIDCSASSKPTFAFSATPAEGMLDAANNNHNQITEPTAIMNCNITGVKGMLLYDNKVKYCLKTFLLDNCTVHLESENMTNGSIIYIYDGGGFINDLTFTNSTIWNTGANHNYLIRYNNSGRCDRAGYATNSINFLNCTMYNIAKSGQMCNHGGFDGRATSNYDIEDCIFVDCGNNQVPRRIVGRRGAGAEIVFNHNTYWFDGAPETEGAPESVETGTSTYDDSHNALQGDPALADPDNGNFTPSGAEQLQYKTGDPRWLP
ncbi:MAG: DUF4957 domain-containing protein [Prevotella sp.]|nr:DUF4957 domain-containing protein [Prevotella sp.]